MVGTYKDTSREQAAGAGFVTGEQPRAPSGVDLFSFPLLMAGGGRRPLTSILNTHRCREEGTSWTLQRSGTESRRSSAASPAWIHSASATRPRCAASSA